MKTDYLYALENIFPSKKLRRVILSLTARCNSKCKTCNIWKMNFKDQLSFDDLKKFAGSIDFKKIKFLALTGGEPFLRKDIGEIVNMFKEKNPKLHITILTNALLPQVIYEKVKSMPKDVLITLSFNGKPETHDETRGIKGNFNKLLKTIENLKKLNQKTNLIFTVTKENYNQLLWAWDFAKKHNLNILFNPEMNYGRLNTDKGRELNKKQKALVLNQLKQIYLQRHRWFFDYTYLLFFRKLYENRTITKKCYAGTNSIYIDYDGNTYPCENLAGRISPLGNIKQNFAIPKNYEKKIREMRCYENCFLLGEMVRNLRKHPIKALIER